MDNRPIKELSDVLSENAVDMAAFDTMRDYLKRAEMFIEIQPLYYDKNGIWWAWDKMKNKWRIIDEVDIMNAMDERMRLADSTSASVKCEMIEALKRKARNNVPIELDPTWVQFKDKIVDFDTGEEYDATSKYFASNPIPWSMGTSEDTPVMDRTFTEWVGPEGVPMLYEILAFSLAQKYFISRIFCFIGSGANGKSTFFSVLRKFIGDDNCCAVDLDDIMESRFAVSKMHKKLVCLMGETNFSNIRKSSKLKNLSSGIDMVGFEYKHKGGFDAVSYAKIMIATNSLPVTEDKTYGFYRRWSIIDFPNRFTEKRDILDEIPDEEFNNLARKCVRLLKELYERRTFTREMSVEERERAYEDKSNPLKRFIRTQCDVSDINGEMPFWEFYELFDGFLSQNGYRRISKVEVSKRLRDDGYDIRTDKLGDSTRRMIIGIAMKRVAEEKQKTL
jgi:putative DNA primase/helicase